MHETVAEVGVGELTRNCTAISPLSDQREVLLMAVEHEVAAFAISQ